MSINLDSKNISSNFGSWINTLNELKNEFDQNPPFPNLLIKDFFNHELVEALYDAFPDKTNQNWCIYHNPLEKKYSMNKFEDLPIFKKLIDLLNSSEFISYMKTIAGIENLESDPYFHGTGLHFHPKGGKLDMHLDYSVHPISGKERRVNLIVYLNKNWNPEYGGELQLWDSEFTKPIKKISPEFNSAILFRTSDISYHGLPFPIQCPEDSGRKSIAIYYLSDLRPNITHRSKAEFRKLPDQESNEKLDKLYQIRKTRIITKQDLDEIWPNWENEGNGHW